MLEYETGQHREEVRERAYNSLADNDVGQHSPIYPSHELLGVNRSETIARLSIERSLEERRRF